MKNIEKNLKKIGTALNLNQRTTLTILQNLCIDNGYISITNLDTYVKIKTDIEGSFLSSIQQFNKCLSIDNSRNDSGDLSDFPGSFPIKDKRELPINLFSKLLKQMINYAAIDFSRGILQNINFTPNYATWTTDGHHACIDHSILSPIPLSIKTEVALILDILLSAGETIQSVHACNKVEKEIEGQINYERIVICTENCTISSKMPNGDILPNIKRVIPLEDQKETAIPEDVIQLFKASIDKLLPYANDKTHLIKISGNTLYVKCVDKNSVFKITLPIQIIDPEKLQAMGINGKYFSEILSMINSGAVMRYNTAISAIYFKCENQPDFLLMPLRIIEHDSEDSVINDSEYKQLPLPEIKKKKVVSPKKQNTDLTTACELLLEYSEQWEIKECVDFSQLNDCIQLIKESLNAVKTV